MSPRPLAVDVAVVCAAAASLAHLVAAPGHYTWWPAAGVFFVALGIAQQVWAFLLFRGVRHPGFVLAGIWGTVGVVLLYVASRTVGLPMAPPVSAHGGRWVPGRSFVPNGAKYVGPLDIFTLVAEILFVVILLSMLPAKLKARSVSGLMWVGVALWGAGIDWLVVVTETAEPEVDADAVNHRDLSTTVERSGEVLWLAGAIIVLLMVHTFVIEPVRVRSDSMEPTLKAGAVVLIDKLTFRTRDPHRGDVVVTSDPRTGEPIVKRVVAVAGDLVGIENGLLVVNGASVVEHYIDNDNMEGFYFGPDAVPAGDVFLLGDNRDISVDSRTFGPVASMTSKAEWSARFGHRDDAGSLRAERQTVLDEPRRLGWCQRPVVSLESRDRPRGVLLRDGDDSRQRVNLRTARPTSSNRCNRALCSTPGVEWDGWRSSWPGGASTSSGSTSTTICWPTPGKRSRRFAGCSTTWQRWTSAAVSTWWQCRET